MKRFGLSFLAAIFILMSAGILGAQAQTDLGPQISKAVGEPHPEGNEFWRINHMDLLRHDRDQTMKLGNRDVQASLKECVACHAVNDEAGEPVSFEDPKHTCRTCHDFAAVKIDCFSCHQSTPDADILSGLLEGAPVNVSNVSVSENAFAMEQYMASLSADQQNEHPTGEVLQ